MSKQYGLILPGQVKKPCVREQTKPSIFDESSTDSEVDDGRPKLQAKKTPLSMGPGAMERRMARSIQEKALAEDPTVFQYDELYDEMENKRDAEHQVKAKEPKKPKYIERLMVTAERRKLENELRIERQVQKEREQEGEQFKDKESFVTAAYRKKLEEIRKMQEEEKRDEYLETIGDVTKQQNIDGFYRYLYEQKLGTAKEVNKPVFTAELEKVGDEEIAYKPIKSEKPPQKRAYRKRQASADDEDDVTPVTALQDQKKIHLQNNMDADSDFSIDSSSSENDDSDDDNEKPHKKETERPNEITTSSTTPLGSTKIALNLDSLKKPKEETEVITDKENTVNVKSEKSSPMVPESPPPKPKIDKKLIWEKRTVGEVFDAAVIRYFQRKAARNG